MRIKLTFLATTIFLFLACTSKRKDLTAEWQSRLNQLNKQYDSAIIHRDTAILQQLFDKDFTYTNPEGKVLNKAEQLIAITTSELKWDTGGSSDVSTRIFENTAVMTGQFSASGTYRANPITIRERYTTIWIRRDTNWTIFAEQGTILQ